MSNDKKIFLTPSQAIELLADSEHIHTFRSGHGIMMGADWRKVDIIKLLNRLPEKSIEIGGQTCRRMGHGLVCHHDGPLFIECNDRKLEELEMKLESHE